MSARSVPDHLTTGDLTPGKLRLQSADSFQTYVMVFFREFLRRFCRGQDFSEFSFGPDEAPSEQTSEHPQVTLARYLCNLHHEIYRRGLTGVPIRWTKRMSFAARKVALLQRSFMWELYFARMQVRGKLYSVVTGLAQSAAAQITALGTFAGFSSRHVHADSLKPP